MTRNVITLLLMLTISCNTNTNVNVKELSVNHWMDILGVSVGVLEYEGDLIYVYSEFINTDFNHSFLKYYNEMDSFHNNGRLLEKALLNRVNKNLQPNLFRDDSGIIITNKLNNSNNTILLCNPFFVNDTLLLVGASLIEKNKIKPKKELLFFGRVGENEIEPLELRLVVHP